MSSQFSWMPLGGLGEVGMNCMLMKFGKKTLPIDAGLLFADPNDYGIDAVYPDFRSLLKEGVKDWIITHGHEDHIGAIPSVFYLCKQLDIEAPRFYAPPLAHALISLKLSDPRYPGLSRYKDNLIMVRGGDEIELDAENSKIKIKFIEIRHSTPESCSLAIEWSGLKILHTADFKLDYHEFEDGLINVKDYDVFKNERPDFLFIDSTNSDRGGQSISELEIKEHLEEVIQNTPGRLFVTLFSSNIYRIALLINLAEKLGRKVCLAGRSMKQIYHAASSLGIFNKCPSFSESTLIEPEESANLDPRKVLVICSGSQGEFRSVLSKIAGQSHPTFKAGEGDTVLFSSRMIPGNEKSVMRLIDGLLHLGVRVLWGETAKETIGGPIHASGHGRADELREVIRFLKPKNLIPVHGALHQLKATENIALSVAEETKLQIKTFIALNNSWLRFELNDTHEWEIKDRHHEEIPQEKFLKFENFDSPSRDIFLKARKFAADGGCISIAVDSLGRAQIDLKGVLPENFEFSHSLSNESLRGEIESWVSTKLRQIEKSTGVKANNPTQLQNEIEDELARWVKKITGSRPLVFIHYISI